MSWWRDARFGMFIHWGIYSVPAGVWKGSRAKNFPAEWIMFEKQIPKKEYARLADRFNPVRFDAREWAGLAKNAGMKYMVITSKHHDGFCMYHSRQTSYNIVDGTPFKRDVIAELAEACAEAGIRFGLYYSVLDWRFCSYPYYFHYKPRFAEYYRYMLAQVKEILTDYGDICSLFFDGNWFPQWKREHGAEVERVCRILQPGVVINDRLRERKGSELLKTLSGRHHEYKPPEIGDYVTPEQYIPDKPLGLDWETCMTMNDSWGCRSWDNNWKSSKELIRNIVDIASKGGNYLLNVGPTSRGIIPEPSVSRLEQIGKWMQKNGESVYGTTGGLLQEPAWGRITRKPDKTYLHVFDWPGGMLSVPGFTSKVKKAYLLADPATELEVYTGGKGIDIKLPERAPDPIDSVVAVETQV